MVEVFVTVNYKDKNYLTNVIVNKDLTWGTIKQIAEEQVKRQWEN
ncbi:BA3454 family stress response protein [Pullulanibacillus sp. KACC 23026]|nr:BA3454 family stress response protein [Pullulanibacillus sp. KACC 23026]WEG14403.1 BA3454 family stress response protein [Pullulanibacillus sp. KACC 23026]